MLLLLGKHIGAVFPVGKQPHQTCRQEDGKEQVLGTEETLAIDKQCVYEYFHAITQRDTCCDDKEQYRLDNGHLSAFLHPLTWEIEGQNQQEHGHGEMVGNDTRRHDMGKTVEEERQQDRIEAPHPDDILEDTVQEDNRIDITYQEDCRQEKLHEIVACQCDESVIEQEQRIDHKGKQRMTEHLIGRTPMGHHSIGNRVVTWHMKLTIEHSPVIYRLL